MENEEIKTIPGFREDQMTGYKPGRVYDPEWNRWVDDPVSRRTDIVPGSEEVVKISVAQKIKAGLLTKDDLKEIYQRKLYSNYQEEDKKEIEKLFSESDNEKNGGEEK